MLLAAHLCLITFATSVFGNVSDSVTIARVQKQKDEDIFNTKGNPSNEISLSHGQTSLHTHTHHHHHHNRHHHQSTAHQYISTARLCTGALAPDYNTLKAYPFINGPLSLYAIIVINYNLCDILLQSSCHYMRYIVTKFLSLYAISCYQVLSLYMRYMSRNLSKRTPLCRRRNREIGGQSS